jgi:diguanylate cyclase (GGDEF)-like protein
MFNFSAFRSRVERNIVLAVLVCGLLPLAALAMLAMAEIEEQTLKLAEKQLRESTKAYALDLLNQIERAESEIRLLYLGGTAVSEGHSVGGFSVIEPPVQLPRTVLALGEQSLLLQVPQGDVVLIGTIAFDVLFEGLGSVPYGVERCVSLNDRLTACHGTTMAEEAAKIGADWQLPLSSVYETGVELSITSMQLQTVALQHLSLVARMLPLAILLAALVIGWLLMLQIRRVVSPLADLKAATLSVSEGDYAHRVDVKTGDEFEKLGEDFNLMTERLGQSFEKTRALGEIDRLILAGATTQEIIRHAMLLSANYSDRAAQVYLFSEPGHGGVLFALAGESLDQQTLSLELRESTTEQAQYLLQTHIGELTSGCFPIRRNGRVAGFLLAVGTTEDAANTLPELADRISVAATNVDQAEALYRQANYDVLTGLINRQAFNDRLQDQLKAAHRRDARGALLFLDLDRFKQVNDTEGHLIGDQMLSEVARRLKSGLRNTDVVARLGGDEFAIIFPELKDQAELTMLCERLLDSVCRPFEVDAFNHPVDVSVGVSIFPDDGVEAGALLMKADVAMYKAKEHKGSAYAFFDDSLNEATERRVRIEARLRSVIDENRLELHFQPKLNLVTGRVEQVEGLIRWPHDDEDPLSPNEFIPVAEDTGLIQSFTRLLLDQSAQCLKASDAEELGLQRVAINISSQQFSRPGFADHFLEELVRFGLASNRLELELTESVFIDDSDRIVAELEKLRAAGVHVALDDFGTGYSSLNLLRTLPLDAIKIDRSFITPLATSAEARSVTRKIIEIARLLKLEVVAEGVEDSSELELLRELECDLVQGFFLSKALPRADLMNFLRSLQDTDEESVVSFRRR